MIGSMLGPYRVVEKIGEGGMGEVYKARDTRLDRSVAIKVLPPALAFDSERRARFAREAKSIAGLSHPHICTLHDVGEPDRSTGSGQGGMYLVMEYLVGETLAARLRRGPLPLAQALTVATEIADALAAAHRQGIIHRDLKPGNVMLTKAGAKLLGFGLAKLKGHGEQPAAAGLASAPTQSTPLTGEGMIVGTLQYMAPEQVEGKDADARSDIFAMGTVLYEMVTGRKAFPGTTQASVIAAILGAEPPAMSTAQPTAPPALDRLVQRCLAKDPDQRWQSAHDVMLALNESAAQPVSRAPASPLRRSLPWAVAVLSLAAATANVYVGRGANAEQPAVELTLLAPEKTTFDSVAISPDGRRLAFTATDLSGKTQLWVRPLDAQAAQPLNGTDGAMSPFWSPDSRFIAFFADGRLKKIEAVGGPLQTLADAADPCLGAFGGDWNGDGVVLFPRTHGDRVLSVSLHTVTADRSARRSFGQ